MKFFFYRKMIFKDHSQREQFARKFIREAETLKLSINNLTKSEQKVVELNFKI